MIDAEELKNITERIFDYLFGAEGARGYFKLSPSFMGIVKAPGRRSTEVECVTIEIRPDIESILLGNQRVRRTYKKLSFCWGIGQERTEPSNYHSSHFGFTEPKRKPYTID